MKCSNVSEVFVKDLSGLRIKHDKKLTVDITYTMAGYYQFMNVIIFSIFPQ